ncbi:hypothetical protein B0H16DRAFT_1471278 [Mycena metata]|uniref:Uncharacterized protein n=1 Tax=Mycena metata TaxID=1033252 RepID=A0AAD7HSV4_9AGAR|nr:hypothetical protein B0H16DRAFT_1471278 [Mycena metata]
MQLDVADLELDLEDQAELPLVTNDKGEVLFRVSHSAAYNRVLADASKVEQKEEKKRKRSAKPVEIPPLVQQCLANPVPVCIAMTTHVPVRVTARDDSRSRLRYRDRSRHSRDHCQRDSRSHWRHRRSRSPHRREHSRTCGEKEKNPEIHSRSCPEATAHDLALQQRIAPQVPQAAKRAHPDAAEADDRGGKRLREESVGTAANPYRLQFLVKKTKEEYNAKRKGGWWWKSIIFYATDFAVVEHHSEADLCTLMENPEDATNWL